MRMILQTMSKLSRRKGKLKSQIDFSENLTTKFHSKDIGAFDIDSKVRNGRLALIYR